MKVFTDCETLCQPVINFKRLFYYEFLLPDNFRRPLFLLNIFCGKHDEIRTSFFSNLVHCLKIALPAFLLPVFTARWLLLRADRAHGCASFDNYFATFAVSHVTLLQVALESASSCRHVVAEVTAMSKVSRSVRQVFGV